MANKKFLGLLTLALALGGLVACGDNKGDSKTSSKCKHNYEVVEGTQVAATCTEKGSHKEKCTICGEEKDVSDKALGHDYVDQPGAVEPTCTEGGSKNQKCSRCGDEKTVTSDPLGHDMVDNPDKAGTDPTCTDAGTKWTKCSRCDHEEEVTVNALGHNYVDDETDAANKAATCTEAGVRVQKCSRCGGRNEVAVDALGHKYELVGDETEPEEGYAAVRIYTCTNGCNDTKLGFKASEPSAESKEHLVIDADGGARFFGRPIGNDLELNPDTGESVNQQVGELVFNENQPGDYFEYKFKLTAAQAATLQDCYLYCDAKPADYMAANGIDFWAYGANSEDWTPGAYVEGDRKGEIIDDYRYVLYVDGERKDFDKTMPASPCHADGGNGGGWGMSSACKREEFILPYKFNLHEGENKIKLVMAGGYRSVFYNFTFRPFEAEEPGEDPEPIETHTHDFVFGEAGTAAEGEVAFAKGVCKGCNKDVIKIAAGADMNGNLKQDDKLPKGTSGKYDGTAIAKYVFSATAGKGELYAEAAHDSNGNDARSYYDGKNGGSSLVSPLPDNKTNTVMTWNDAPITLPTATYGELGLPAAANTFALIKIADVDLTAQNTLTLAGTDSYGLKYRSFIIVTSADHAHDFVRGTQIADSELYPAACGCGATGYELDTNTTNTPSLPGDKKFKNLTSTFNVTGIEAGSYAVYFKAHVSAGNENANVGLSYGAELKEGHPGRYYVQVGDTKSYTDTGDKTFANIGIGNSTTYVWTNCAVIPSVAIAAGTTQLVLAHTGAGYSLYIDSIRLVKIA